MKNLFILILITFSLMFFACDGENEDKISFGFDIQPIFNNNCSGCHVYAETPSANLDLSTYESVMFDTSNNGPIIIPKYPENSLLINKIENSPPAFGSFMPFNMPPLSAEEVTIIKTWIYYGARDN